MLKLTTTWVVKMNWVRLAAFILTASAEALASDASPHDGATGSCSSSYNGKFEVTINKLGKRDSEVSNKSHWAVLYRSLV